MARQPKHDQIPAYEKYEVFKKAYDNVITYLEEKNFLAANILAFAILEDRVLAAYFECYNKNKNTDLMTHNTINRLKFSTVVKNLQKMGVIEEKLKSDLLNAADERNRQIHEMLWRLDSFNKKTAENFRSFSYKVSSAHKKFINAGYPISSIQAPAATL